MNSTVVRSITRKRPKREEIHKVIDTLLDAHDAIQDRALIDGVDPHGVADHQRRRLNAMLLDHFRLTPDAAWAVEISPADSFMNSIQPGQRFKILGQQTCTVICYLPAQKLLVIRRGKTEDAYEVMTEEDVKFWLPHMTVLD